MHSVALIRGDGIGPEITDAAIEVLEATGVEIDWVEVPIGQDALRRFGSELPWDALQTVRRLGVALKAPLMAERRSGGVVVEAEGETRRHPSVNNGLRRELETYANLRPMRGWRGVSGRYETLDVVIVREVTEDIYIGLEHQLNGTGEAVKRITRSASERIAHFACEYAIRSGRRTVSAIHKANVLHLTDGLFLEAARCTVDRYSGLVFDDRMVDAACYLLITRPEQFDVMVLPSQYGDIVSDVVGGLIGSLGLAPGANIGPEVAFFEAAHGSAPDIAGRGIVNPISLVLSGALMLDHLGELEAADRIRAGVARVLEERRSLTPDLGGSGNTFSLARAICDAMQE